MRKLTSLWFLPVAIFKWTMFGLVTIRENWDTCSYSVNMQFVGRVWSPTYWLRAIVLIFLLKFQFKIWWEQLKKETNILGAPEKAIVGHIPPKIPLPIRYLYYFVTLYTA